MTHRFLIHSLSHTFVVVDITNVGPSAQVLPRSGQHLTLPAIRFQSWKDAEQYFLSLGAGTALLASTSACLKSTSSAVLTVCQ